jgi:hypothetical protein
LLLAMTARLSEPDSARWTSRAFGAIVRTHQRIIGGKL